MSLVTVKPKFQVTIPARLRRGLDLREGDIMEASVVDGGILLRPKDIVDRDAMAGHSAAVPESNETSEATPEAPHRSEEPARSEAVADSAVDLGTSRDGNGSDATGSTTRRESSPQSSLPLFGE